MGRVRGECCVRERMTVELRHTCAGALWRPMHTFHTSNQHTAHMHTCCTTTPPTPALPRPLTWYCVQPSPRVVRLHLAELLTTILQPSAGVLRMGVCEGKGARGERRGAKCGVVGSSGIAQHQQCYIVVTALVDLAHVCDCREAGRCQSTPQCA